MKRLFYVSALLFLTASSYAQQVPTITNPANGGINSGDYWSRGGNTNANGYVNNIIGTRWNSPMYFITGGLTGTTYRMKLNGIFTSASNQYTIDTYGFSQDVNTTGYLLIGQNTPTYLGGPNELYSSKGAYSQLHLNGDGTFTQQFGYRPWMKTGVTFTSNNDLAYIGQRQLGTDYDVTETIISWADNQGGASGPDDLSFRFTTSGNGTGYNTSNLRATDDIDGLHIARFTGAGRIGFGNTFGVNTTGTPTNLYTTPQSLLHMSYDWQSGSLNEPYGFGQITYRRDGTSTPGTGETANDGLRWGIDNDLITASGISYLSGYLRWQEYTPFIIQTDWDNSPGNTQSGERMRILSTTAPGVAASSFGYTNVTRVAINYLGSSPITQPRALLHLGTNVNQGFANWMDFGTLTASNGATLFTGITSTAYAEVEQSAIGFGSSNLLFLNATYGEMGRIQESNQFWGFGDYGPGGIAAAPSERIDVDGNGRFRNIPAQGGQSLILGLEQGNGAQDVELSRLEFPNDNTQVLLGDGTWGTLTPSGGFTPCSDNTGAANLQSDSKVNLNDYNLFFENNGLFGQNHIGIGYDCATPLEAKLSVIQLHPSQTNQGSIAISGINRDVSTVAGSELVGVKGFSIGVQNTSQFIINKGGDFFATGAPNNFGVQGVVQEPIGGTSNNTAGVFRTSGGAGGTGAVASSGDATGTNIGLMATAWGGTSAYGVYASGGGATSNNWAGYFAGDLFAVNYQNLSDSMFKQNVSDFDNASNILEQLHPVSYDFRISDFPSLPLSTGKQIGLIAQEVETVLPDLVKETNHPDQLDEAGNVLEAGFTFKSINYQELIPVLIAGHQEQNAIIDSLAAENDSLKNELKDLNDRLSAIESCLSNLMPDLCEMNQMAVHQNSREVQEQLREMMEVRLSDKNSIVLNQNVPNPFAESTVISYVIPESVQRAQLLFYDKTGRLIQTVEISERGNGELRVFADDLSMGTYSYTLVADGKQIATKYMVKY